MKYLSVCSSSAPSGGRLQHRSNSYTYKPRPSKQGLINWLAPSGGCSCTLIQIKPAARLEVKALFLLEVLKASNVRIQRKTFQNAHFPFPENKQPL